MFWRTNEFIRYTVYVFSFSLFGSVSVVVYVSNVFVKLKYVMKLFGCLCQSFIFVDVDLYQRRVRFIIFSGFVIEALRNFITSFAFPASYKKQNIIAKQIEYHSSSTSVVRFQLNISSK